MSDSKGFEQINRRINNEMQEIATRCSKNEHSQGDLERLATLLSPKLQFHIWKFVKNDDSTKDILQNTMAKIFSNIFEKYDPTYRFTTWAYTISENEAKLYIYHQKQASGVDIEGGVESKADKEETNTTNVREEEFRRIYEMAISEIFNLPNSIEKDLMIDKMINKMKGEDLSEKYSLNLNTVKTKLRKVRLVVKEKIIEKDPQIEAKVKNLF